MIWHLIHVVAERLFYYWNCNLLPQHTEALLYGFQSIAETIDVNYSDVIPGLIGLIPRISINNVQLADTVMFTIGGTSFMTGIKESQQLSLMKRPIALISHSVSELFSRQARWLNGWLTTRWCSAVSCPWCFRLWVTQTSLFPLFLHWRKFAGSASVTWHPTPPT